MYLKQLVETIKQCEGSMNKRIYRKMLAKAYTLIIAQQYSNKSEIQYQVNLKLLEHGLKHVSYCFIQDTLKEN